MNTWGDVRDTTHAMRDAIGYAPREAWRTAPAQFSDHALVIHDHPVMEDWEDDYMRMLAAIASSEGGTVLEVGYGMGLAARHIQSHRIDKHVIIEANESVFEELRIFARTARVPVVALQGFWEEIVDTLPSASFSGILFDTYPLSSDEVHRNHFPFFEAAHRLLRPGGILTYYSDEITDYSSDHRERLQSTGFTRIRKRICHVSPPADCVYWKSDHILAPLIWK